MGTVAIAKDSSAIATVPICKIDKMRSLQDDDKHSLLSIALCNLHVVAKSNDYALVTSYIFWESKEWEDSSLFSESNRYEE